MPLPKGSIGRVVVDADQLAERVQELGAQVTEDYRGRNLLLVGVLKGAFVFMSDLAREIQLPVEIDFMATSSYGTATKTTGVVKIAKDLDIDITGRDVLLVEDIVDSGATLEYIIHYLSERQPASLAVCALLVREGTKQHKIDYVGFSIPKDFVVGYGLDVAEHYRELSSISVFEPANKAIVQS